MSINATSFLPKLNNNLRSNNFSSFAKDGKTITVTMKGQSPEAHAQAILDKFKFKPADEKKFKETFGYDLRKTITESYRNKDDKTSHKSLGNGFYQTTIPIDKEMLAQIREIKPENKQQAKVKVETKPKSPSNPNEAIAGKNGIATPNANTPNVGETASIIPLGNEPKTKFSVLLNNDGKPPTNERILTQFVQDRYQGGNLWGENYNQIANMSAAQGAKADNINDKGSVGNKRIVYFEVSVKDQVKIHENSLVSG